MASTLVPTTIVRGPSVFRPLDIRTLDPRRISDELKKLTDAIAAIPFLNGNLIQNISLTGTTDIAHGLGRAFVGWWLIDPNGTAAATIFRNTTGAVDTTQFLRLTVSAPISCSLWVF